MSGQCGGHKCGFWVGAPYSGGQILRRTEKEARVTGPLETLHEVVVTGEDPVPHERGELQLPLGIGVGSGRSVPDFDVTADADGEIPAGRAEGERGHGRLEGEMVEDALLGQVGEDGSAIAVDRQQEITPRTQAQTGDVSSMGERQSVRFVASPETSALGCVEPDGCPHLTRSNTETRLPTGDKRHVPSGVKRRLPLQ